MKKKRKKRRWPRRQKVKPVAAPGSVSLRLEKLSLFRFGVAGAAFTFFFFFISAQVKVLVSSLYLSRCVQSIVVVLFFFFFWGVL